MIFVGIKRCVTVDGDWMSHTYWRQLCLKWFRVTSVPLIGYKLVANVSFLGIFRLFYFILICNPLNIISNFHFKMSNRMNTMSIYRRRSSAFIGSSFGYQNRRASDIAIPKGLASFQSHFGDIDEENDDQSPADQKRDWTKLFITFVLCYGNFCVGSAYSVLGPLFPNEVNIDRLFLLS